MQSWGRASDRGRLFRKISLPPPPLPSGHTIVDRWPGPTLFAHPCNFLSLTFRGPPPRNEAAAKPRLFFPTGRSITIGHSAINGNSTDRPAEGSSEELPKEMDVVRIRVEIWGRFSLLFNASDALSKCWLAWSDLESVNLSHWWSFLVLQVKNDPSMRLRRRERFSPETPRV